MDESEKVRRINITLDQECIDILDFFSQKEMKASGTIRLAIKEFYTLYVQKSLHPGEAVIDPDGTPAPLDALVHTPRAIDPKTKMEHAPVEDVQYDDDPQ